MGFSQVHNGLNIPDRLRLEESVIDLRQSPTLKAISEGAHARSAGRPKDACPYPARSPERKAWLEGYDCTPSEDGPDSPIADA